MNEITSLGQTHVHEYFFPSIAGRNFAKYYWTGSAWETEYLHANPLDSTQVVTRSDNSIAEAEVFYPFGGLRWRAGGTQDVRFAGMQERDGETTLWQDPLDPTPNRLYTSGLGRWLTPDPAGKGAAQLEDPQTWNMYAYVRNNPTTLTDPSGLLLAQPSLVMALQALAHASEATKEDDSEEKREAGEATQTDQSGATASQTEAQPNQDPTPAQSDDFTLKLGGTEVKGSLQGATVDGSNGVLMKAEPRGCDDCSWAQTVSRTGTAATPDHTDREKGGQPLYPKDAPSNLLVDSPATHPGGVASFRAVSSLGVAHGKTFEIRGSMTWGYDVDKAGHVRKYGPRVATHEEQRESIRVLRRDSPSWTITGP